MHIFYSQYLKDYLVVYTKFYENKKSSNEELIKANFLGKKLSLQPDLKKKIRLAAISLEKNL